MANYPTWIENQNGVRKVAWRRYWRKPWKVPRTSSRKRAYKRELWEHGYLSTNFSRLEARSKDGTSIPLALKDKAQYHAFSLERVRHKRGDNPLRPLSWYRSPNHNRAVGGATNSQHLQAWATDWAVPNPASAELNHEFRNGGRGYRSGQVAHADNGPARTWLY